MNLRFLAPEEYDILHKIEEFGGVYPDPRTSRVLVAESPEGSLVAFWVMEGRIHLEPFWVSPEHRGKGGAIYKKMVPVMYAAMNELGEQSFFITAPLDLDIKADNVVQSGGNDTLDYLLRLGLVPIGVSMVGLVPSKD